MPNFEVWPTALADRQLRDLRGETRKNAKKARDRLERRGCEAADYHLEGDEVERLCVVNLGRGWRIIVAFQSATRSRSSLLAVTSRKRPQVDVYRRLYDSLGIALPTIKERTGHPPWCPTGEAPVDRDLVDTFIAHGRQLRRRARGRKRRL